MFQQENFGRWLLAVAYGSSTARWKKHGGYTASHCNYRQTPEPLADVCGSAGAPDKYGVWKHDVCLQTSFGSCWIDMLCEWVHVFVINSKCIICIFYVLCVSCVCVIITVYDACAFADTCARYIYIYIYIYVISMSISSMKSQGTTRTIKRFMAPLNGGVGSYRD